MRIIACAVHGLLYLLLFTQIALGLLFRWSQQVPFNFFGLFDIPTFIYVDNALRHTLAGLHNNVAWALIFLAGAHALAALFHHYVLRANVLYSVWINELRAQGVRMGQGFVESDELLAPDH